MSSITAIHPRIWRWDGIEAEHGFPIVGYIVATSEGLMLVDPPHDPDAKEMIKTLGQPFAVIITSAWHVRGAPHWAKEFHIPIAAPPSAREELREAGAYAEVALLDGYEEAGWRVIKLAVDAYDEVAFWSESHGVLVVGDLLVTNETGDVALGAHQYMEVPLDKLRPIVEQLAQLQPKLILSAHLGPRDDGAQILSGLLESIPSE